MKQAIDSYAIVGLKKVVKRHAIIKLRRIFRNNLHYERGKRTN